MVGLCLCLRHTHTHTHTHTGRGCYACPLYPTGEHPTYLKKAAEREAKKRARKASQATDCITPLMTDGSAYENDVDLSSIFSDDDSTLSQ